MSEQEKLLARIKALRTPAESSDGTTEEVEAVDVSVETPGEEESSEEVLETDELEEEVEQLEESSETDDIEEESLVVEIDGEEISLDDIKKWRAGNLRQSDYTSKTQLLADDKKSFESKRGKQKELLETLESQISVLSEMTEAEFKDVDWDELRDIDTAEYLKLKEHKENSGKKIQTAKEKLKNIKDSEMSEMIASEQKKLLKALPEWSSQEKQQADIAMLNKYLDAKGISDDEFGKVTNHRQMLAFLDAAKFYELKSKAPANAKKVKKAPIVVKGKKPSVASIDRQIKDAQSRLKMSGKIEDAIALTKLKRQQTG